MDLINDKKFLNNLQYFEIKLNYLNNNYKKLNYLLNSIEPNHNKVCNFFNLKSGKEIYMDDSNILSLNNIIKLFTDNDLLFMPILEIPNRESNFVFEIYFGLSYQKVSENQEILDNIKNFIAKKIGKIYKYKQDLDILFYERKFKNKLVYKIQVLNLISNRQTRIAIFDEINSCLNDINQTILENSTSKFKINKMMIANLVEPYTMTVYPHDDSNKYYSGWEISSFYRYKKTSFNTQCKEFSIDKIHEAILKVDNYFILYLCNNYNLDFYKKDIFNLKTDDGKDENITFSEKLKHIYALQNDPDLAFYDLVINHLPNEFKTIEHVTNIIKELKIIPNTEFLIKSFISNIGDETINEMYPKLMKRKLERDLFFGFYVYQVRKIPEFVSELNVMITNYIKKNLLSGSGAINDIVIANVMKYLYFENYVTTEDQSKKHLKSTNFLRYEYNDYTSDNNIKYFNKWTQFSFSSKLNHYLTIEIPKYFDEIYNTFNFNSDDKEIKKNTNAIKKNIENSKKKMLNDAPSLKIYNCLDKQIYFKTFSDFIDKNPNVIGVKNGILFLDLYSNDPKPILYKTYSPYIVSKSANGKYIPWKKLCKTAKFIPLFKQIFKDIFPQKDARLAIKCHLSTAIENVLVFIPLLQKYGPGSGGKSLIDDWMAFILTIGDYAAKLSNKLFTSDNKGNEADPNMMDLKGKRYGYCAETNRNDFLVSSRLKSVTEQNKHGRSLFENNSVFQSNVTIVLSTNYKLQIRDFDYGTWRRLMIYECKTKFVEKPDPNDPNEKKIDKSLPNLLIDNPRAADEFISYLVHLRCKFQRDYGSNFEKIESPTLEKCLTEYKRENDKITEFIETKIVHLYGYKDGKVRVLEGENIEKNLEEINNYYNENNIAIEEQINLTVIINAFEAWYLDISGQKYNKSPMEVLEEFRNSKLNKFIIGTKDTSYIKGFRLIQYGKEKIKGEIYVH